MSAKSVIELWLWGGPSSLETFDPKPNASFDYNNGLKAIPTNVPGVEIHEWWPELAKCADLYSLIRSMTHPHFGHETATYLMQTGRNPGGGEVYPAIGAVISMIKSKSYHKDLPPYVILTTAKGRFSEVGFLGDKYAPLVTGGNPNSPRFVVDGIVPPGEADSESIRRRFDLLADIDSFDVPGVFDDFKRAGYLARQIIDGDAAKTFDLSQESDAVRDRYGRTWIGQSLLAARRLVEYGVPYITINMSGWDSHKRHFETMRQRTLDTDRALAALLCDLKAKNLLDSTIVWVSGEFGRTTRIDRDPPWNGGRNHYPKCFSSLVAGGGFKGGCVVGQSDDTASNVVKRPVTPVDFLGSIYELCGINPDGPMPNEVGKKLTILPPQSSLGRLREIYRKWILTLCFAGLSLFSVNAAEPYVGYLYPAGLQAGTTNTVLVGGQGLNAVREGYVSGKGVKVTSIELVPNSAPPTPDQRKYLVEWLKRLAEGDKSCPEIPPNARTNEWRSNRWWRVLNELDIYKLSLVKRDLFTKRNALQMSPSLRQMAIVTIAVDQDAQPGAREFRLWGGNGMSPPRPFIVSNACRQKEPLYEVPFKPAAVSPIIEPLPTVLDGQIFPGEVDKWRIRLKKGEIVTFRVVAREFQPYIGDAVPGFFNAALRLMDDAGNEVGFADDNAFHPDPVLTFAPKKSGVYELMIHDVLYRGREDFVYSIFIEKGKRHITPTDAMLWNSPKSAIPNSAIVAEIANVLRTPQMVAEHEVLITAPGDYVFELVARRAGSPLDGRIIVENEAGRAIADFSDVTNRVHCGSIIQGELDPIGVVNIPKVGRYRVLVTDEQGKGGLEWTYRLLVHRLVPRFEVWFNRSSFILRPGGRVKTTAHIIRHDGFKNDIRLIDTSELRFQPSILPANSNQVEVIAISKLKRPTPIHAINIFAESNVGATTQRTEVVPADEYNQAFAWNHLLPASTFIFKGLWSNQNQRKKKTNAKNR